MRERVSVRGGPRCAAVRCPQISPGRGGSGAEAPERKDEGRIHGACRRGSAHSQSVHGNEEVTRPGRGREMMDRAREGERKVNREARERTERGRERER